MTAWWILVLIILILFEFDSLKKRVNKVNKKVKKVNKNIESHSYRRLTKKKTRKVRNF